MTLYLSHAHVEMMHWNTFILYSTERETLHIRYQSNAFKGREVISQQSISLSYRSVTAKYLANIFSIPIQLKNQITIAV